MSDDANAALLMFINPLAAEDEVDHDNRPMAPTLSKEEMREDLLDSLFARLRTANSEREAKITEEAIWKMWMASDSPSAEALLQQATRAMGSRENEAALTILGTLVSIRPDFAEAWNKRATLYFMMHKFPESLADIDKVLDLEPRHLKDEDLAALHLEVQVALDDEGAVPDVQVADGDGRRRGRRFRF